MTQSIIKNDMHENPIQSGPCSNIDLFSDEVLLNPYPFYQELREMGRAVWLSRFGMFIFTHYEDVKNALAEAAIFTSAKGVMMNDRMNETLRGIVLCSDNPEHDVMRKVLMTPP